MRKIDEYLSNKLANMSFVCSILIVCIHTTIECEDTGSFLWVFKNYFTLGGIVSIAVPFFFIVSSYFLFSKLNKSTEYSKTIVLNMKRAIQK